MKFFLIFVWVFSASTSSPPFFLTYIIIILQSHQIIFHSFYYHSSHLSFFHSLIVDTHFLMALVIEHYTNLKFHWVVYRRDETKSHVIKMENNRHSWMMRGRNFFNKTTPRKDEKIVTRTKILGNVTMTNQLS